MSEKKQILLKDLKTEDYYDAPLWLDDHYLLLSPDIALSSELVVNLKKWGYKNVLTEGSASLNNATGTSSFGAVEGATFNNDAKEEEHRQEAKKFFTALVVFVQKTYVTFNQHGNLNMAAITDRVKEIINIVKELRTSILRLPDLTAEGFDYLYTHAARSTIIAITLGEALKLANFRLIELGIAALLHEVGMLKIPQRVYEKPEQLTNAEKKLITTHTLQGMKMLQDYSKKNADPLAQNILIGILQHHERINGKGYPQGLRGDTITLFGKIIAVACSYDAQISRRPHREERNGYESMLLMLKQTQHLYDEKIISALLNTISIYPLGSYVHMNNGSVGIVVNTGEINPKYPVVRVYLDEKNHPYKDSLLVKTEENGIMVAKVLSKTEKEDLISKNLLPS